VNANKYVGIVQPSC